jgi:Fe-S oxidoreductase
VELAREGARENLAALEPYEMIVTGCASCTLMLKDYPALFEDGPEREAARRLAGKVRHIAEVIAEQPEPNAWSEQGRREARPRRVTYHSSCHLRAAGVSKAPRDILGRLPGVTFTEMADADRCAGGAGTFVIKDYDTSQRIFERKRRAIDASMAEEVVTSCPACMIQLRNGLPDAVAVKHLAQVVLEADLARSS